MTESELTASFYSLGKESTIPVVIGSLKQCLYKNYVENNPRLNFYPEAARIAAWFFPHWRQITLKTMDIMNASFFQGSIETRRRFVNTADLSHATYKLRLKLYQSISKEELNEALPSTLGEVALILKTGYEYIPIKEDTPILEDVKNIIEDINKYLPQGKKTVYGYFNPRDGHDLSKYKAHRFLNLEEMQDVLNQLKFIDPKIRFLYFQLFTLFV